ncbi:MAG: hypothetical protein Q8J63_06415 [Candidatus Aquicultor sp.]|nr:hypothetical protein [Candidatus Aquicultor sp.]
MNRVYLSLVAINALNATSAAIGRNPSTTGSRTTSGPPNLTDSTNW